MTETYKNPYSAQLVPAKNIIDIVRALTAEKDINRLLEMILDEALRISTADAGTLYIVNKQATHLDFAFVRNKSLGVNSKYHKDMGELPSVPLYFRNGSPNMINISSCAALTGKTFNIENIYNSKEFKFSGARAYDEKTGYRSQSMLVIPMFNHENTIIGVLQLLNATNQETGEVVSFDQGLTGVAFALASLAATALNNRQLIAGLKHLFDSFIKSIAAAVDEKSPYTGGHITRVVELVRLIAQGINTETTGAFADFGFTADELEELKIAAWMHDVGKITTPEYVVNKSTKLETLRDGIHTVRLRFRLVAQELESMTWKKMATGSEHGEKPCQDEIKRVEDELQREKERLESDLEFVCQCNTGKFFMEDHHLQRLEEIASRRVFPGQMPLLTTEEMENLTIRKGNLTQNERQIIENHVIVTQKILNELPFPRSLHNVPKIASAHHEKLDGSGYPDGKDAAELNLATRIMAIADIFEALTAADRPYKHPMPLSKALDILDFMEKDGHIDKDIVRLFREKRLFAPYAEQYLKPEQVDI
ncbi:HD domain-containing phosphohydrolase [uncultured Desulfobacter sp.]|uniref:HD domain-containing phosphohydrolase n=1 Tax=uncultured Desulfobacter sp. TaxID=240139 RepID=UPI002AABE87A|nr:HD domain-containing phosphohydrolase [uncultured Desulfobacter sp.]